MGSPILRKLFRNEFSTRRIHLMLNLNFQLPQYNFLPLSLLPASLIFHAVSVFKLVLADTDLFRALPRKSLYSSYFLCVSVNKL